jgi:putative DNA primase/helicase
MTYVLPFDYDPLAEAPLFHAYINRVLPEQRLQDILAEYTGYIFARGLKLEKVALLFGIGANGKSVFADILNALLGKDNVCGFSLHSITKSDSWQRAELEHKLLNYSSEINTKMESDTFKKLVSGEPVEAHRKYKDPYTMDSCQKV